MATVTMIPAKARAGARDKTKESHKLRVAAYCCVSTDTDEQATSYDAQIEHYTEYIKKNPGWELAGIYADDGISGTNTKKREEFNRLIENGTTQTEVAEKLGVSLSYVNRITKGREQIVNKTFVKMMDELGYDVEITYKKKVRL